MTMTMTVLMLSAYSIAANCSDVTADKDHQPKAIGVEHVLSNKVWDARNHTLISQDHLLKELSHATYVLLGEIHDNRDHHILQSQIVSGLEQLGRKPAVVMEMFDSDEQPAIDRVLASNDASADRLFENTHAVQDGWPEAAYKPLLETLLANGLHIFAGDLNDKEIQNLHTGGLAVLGNDRLSALNLQQPLAASYEKILREQIIQSHCGYAEARHVNSMLDIQRARDGYLADGLITHATDSGSVLIAGAGHVRTDFAVPSYLRARQPNQEYKVVAFIEVNAGMNAPDEYLPETTDAESVYDFLWFTPAVSYEDPCEKFREQLKKID